MRWPHLRIRFTLELGERPAEPKPEPAGPTYGDGWMDNAGTAVEQIGQPRMVGFQREDATRLEEGEHDRRR